jgi:hypothetical protein
MTEPAVRRRSLAGRLLIVAGIGLFFLWAYYFLDLVRNTDAWDLCPLPVALAAILIGIKLVRLDVRILAMIGVSYKRDLAIALAIGALVELILWALTGLVPQMAARFSQLERLQEPSLRIALVIIGTRIITLGGLGLFGSRNPVAFWF